MHPTRVNGKEVEQPECLKHGDLITVVVRSFRLVLKFFWRGCSMGTIDINSLHHKVTVLTSEFSISNCHTVCATVCSSPSSSGNQLAGAECVC